MAHPDIQPTPGARFDTQQGVAQGTTIKRRRNPRKEVNDVSITQADGASLGPDGNFHPIETDVEGNLKVRVLDITTLMEEQNELLRQIVFGLTLLTNNDLSEC